MVGWDHHPVRLALRGLLSAAGRAAMPIPYSHTEGRLLLYDAQAAPVQHCLWAAVTAAQDEPSLAPWLGPAEQHVYGSMPAAAVDKVFEHLHATHDALARVVGRRQPSPAGTDPAEGDLPESGKRLQAAVLCYDTLAARAGSVPGGRGTAWHPVRGGAAAHGGAAGCVARVPPDHTGPATGGAGESSTPPTSPSDGKPCGEP